MIETEREKQIAKEKRKPEDVHSLLKLTRLSLNLGTISYLLLTHPRVRSSRQGYNDKEAVCNRTWNDNPGNQAEDNMQLDPDTYIIKIKGNQVAEGEIMPDHYLGIKSDDTPDSIDGVDTIERAFGLPAKWIHKNNKAKAEMYGLH